MITLEEKKKAAVEMWYHIIDRIERDTDKAVDAAYQIIKAIENWEGPENDRG